MEEIVLFWNRIQVLTDSQVEYFGGMPDYRIMFIGMLILNSHAVNYMIYDSYGILHKITFKNPSWIPISITFKKF